MAQLQKECSQLRLIDLQAGVTTARERRKEHSYQLYQNDDSDRLSKQLAEF